MPITDTNVYEEPPQADGEIRARVEFIFNSGAFVVERRIRANDANDLANKVADLPAVVEQQQQEQDANAVVDTDQEVDPAGEADIRQVALAYLTRAMQDDNPYRAYLKFARFNDWRLREGYSLNQVETALAAVGLTAEQWAQMLAAYQYLSNAGRVQAMVDYQTIAEVWAEGNW